MHFNAHDYNELKLRKKNEYYQDIEYEFCNFLNAFGSMEMHLHFNNYSLSDFFQFNFESNSSKIYLVT